tara:strand:- start:411 stop:545 length:135 start_codon:yes stop_codon:yes gene_type:complete
MNDAVLNAPHIRFLGVSDLLMHGGKLNRCAIPRCEEVDEHEWVL